MTLFHGTTDEITPPFHRLSHFGTHQAALERLRTFAPLPDGEVAYVYEVDCSFESPLEILDHSTERYKPSLCRHMLSRAGLEDTEIKDIMFAPNGADEAIGQAITALEDMGFDSAKYENTNEDYGSTSWVNFQPEQVEIVGRSEVEHVPYFGVAFEKIANMKL